MGLLDEFLKQPGAKPAMGILGSYLIAAGAPTTDPGLRQRLVGRGIRDAFGTMRQARLDEANTQFRNAQMADIQARTEQRNRRMAGQDALQGTLLGSYMGGPGPAAGSPRAAQETGLATPGALSTVPENARPFLLGLAKANPESAAMLGYKLMQPQEYTLAPGAARYRDGKLIAARPATAKPTDRDRRVDMLMETGLPRDIAQGIAAGRYAVSRDPVSQTAQIVDKGTGNIIFPKKTTGTVPGVTPPSMSADVDYSKGTGPSGLIGWGLNTVTDAVAGTLAMPEAERASQGLTNLQVRTQTALQSAIPGRPSNYLMERLDRLAVQPNSLMMGDSRAYERLRQTRDMLREEVDRIDRDILAHPDWYRPQQIAETRANRSQLQAILKNYDVVVGSFEKALGKKAGKHGGPTKGTVVEGYRFKGGDPNNSLNWEKVR